jgi:hypothetical protein
MLVAVDFFQRGSAKRMACPYLFAADPLFEECD